MIEEMKSNKQLHTNPQYGSLFRTPCCTKGKFSFEDFEYMMDPFSSIVSAHDSSLRGRAAVYDHTLEAKPTMLPNLLLCAS